MGVVLRQTKTSTRTVTFSNNNYTQTNRYIYRRQKSREFAFSLKPQVYIGDNFIVRLGNVVKFREKVCSYGKSGISVTEFEKLRTVGAMRLSYGAERIASLPNAGGSSEKSEILSYEMLQKCYGAILDKTEMEVSYFPEGGSITDYTCEIFGYKVGVSVTRAMKYRGEFTMEDAFYLLHKKLNGVLNSTRNTLEGWHKQILHVWATSGDVALILAKAYGLLPEYLKSNTVVLITVCKNTREIF